MDLNVKSAMGGPDREVNPSMIDPQVLALYSFEVGQRTLSVPFYREGNLVHVMMVDPYDITNADDVEFALSPQRAVLYQASRELVEAALVRWARFQASETEQAAVSELEASSLEAETEDSESEDGQMAQLVSQLLDQAIEHNASDIHLQPTGKELVIKFRIDGVLRHHATFKNQLISGIINQIKVRGAMNLSERRVPQDGRATRTYKGREVDLRIVTLPTSWGVEGAIVRLLDRSRSLMNLGQLGFHEHVLKRLEKVLEVPDGIIFVTGPTGSGKTTTLYAALDLVSTPERNTLAIEDPVEIRFPAITQMQVNEKAGLTFATALRHFLRADPDVMLVGEIRDEETAALATQAAQTGHLVLSTLHANSAASAPLRMHALGMSPFDMGDSVRAILAQRLVRRVCPSCKTMAPLTRSQLSVFDDKDKAQLPTMVPNAKEDGCVSCDNIGYRGRLLVSELLVVDEQMSEALASGAPVHEIAQLAAQQGMATLHQDALEWLRSGDTTVEELSRMGLC